MIDSRHGGIIEIEYEKKILSKFSVRPKVSSKVAKIDAIEREYKR